MTRKAALAFGIGASLILAAGTASAAGNCASEVRALQAQLGAAPSEDMSANSGSSATTDTIADATTGTTDPSTPAIEPQNAQDGANPMAAGTVDSATQPSTGSSSTTTTVDNPATGTTTAPSVNTDNSADGANPMASGTQDSTGQPTELSPTVTETSRSGSSADGHSEALASLEKAQLYANAGEEEACMSELNFAKQHMGVQ